MKDVPITDLNHIDKHSHLELETDSHLDQIG